MHAYMYACITSSITVPRVEHNSPKHCVGTNPKQTDPQKNEPEIQQIYRNPQIYDFPGPWMLCHLPSVSTFLGGAGVGTGAGYFTNVIWKSSFPAIRLSSKDSW